MSFIASEKVVRKSPVSFDYTSITIEDLYAIEKEIEEIKFKTNLPKELKLVIHTPGGQAYAATKIAKYLQCVFENIEAYVPYEASSGGTILCIAANEIILDEVANLTPIDPQVPYKDVRISAVSYEQAIQDFYENWGNLSPMEIPSPYQQMSREFDPIVAKQFNKLVTDTMLVAYKLMNQALNKENDPKRRLELFNIAYELVNTRTPHGHVIDKREAKELNLSVSEDTTKLAYLKPFKQWVRDNINEEKTTHIIKTYYPKSVKTKVAKSNNKRNNKKNGK